MFYSIDIGFDAVGPNIVKRSRGEKIQRLSRSKPISPDDPTIRTAILTFPNDKSLCYAEVEFAGETFGAKVDFISTLAHVHQELQADGTRREKSAGGMCYCIDTASAENDGWNQVLRSIVRACFEFGRQGQFSINIYAREELPPNIAVGPLTYDESDEMQNTNQHYILAHQAQRSLTLQQSRIDWSQETSSVMEAEYTYVWGLTSLNP